MELFEPVRDLILLGVGMIGAVLGIINYLELRGRTRRRIKVRIEYAVPFYLEGKLGNQYLKVIATNIGHRDVTITNLGLELPKKRTLAYLQGDAFPTDPDTRMPVTLGDGEIAFKYYPSTEFSRGLVTKSLHLNSKVFPYADDSSGRRHYGKSKRLREITE